MEHDRLDLAPGGDATWCADVPGVAAGQRYGFHVHGPGDPTNGHTCDPAKLLVDPAARRVAGELRWTPELVTPGVDSGAARAPVRGGGSASAAEIDGWPIRWGGISTVVYEAHVGHLTARHPLVPADARGRYAGLAAPAVVDHLQRLGVTALELLPVRRFVSEQALSAAGQRNVWGYNPLAWGAPHAGCTGAGPQPGHRPPRRGGRPARRRDRGLARRRVQPHCEGGLGSTILGLAGLDDAGASASCRGSGAWSTTT